MNEVLKIALKRKLYSLWKILFFILTFGSINLALGALILPLVNFFLLNQILFLVSLIITSKICMMLFEKKLFIDIGLRFNAKTGYHIAFGLFIPIVILGAIFIADIIFDYGYCTKITGENVFLNFLTAIPYFILVAFNEELLFRGFIFQRLLEGFGIIFTILSLSVLFSLAHYFNPHINSLSIINIILAGILFSVAFTKTGSLWLPITLHFSWNFAEGIIFGFPVSGSIIIKSFFMFNSTGPEWITGGDFGPEGGVFATILLCVASLFILFNKKLSKISI